MQIFLLKRKDEVGYDEYSETVVVAESSIAARFMHPSNAAWLDKREKWAFVHEGYTIANESANKEWTHPRNVEVFYLGEFHGNKEDFLFFPVIQSNYRAG